MLSAADHERAELSGVVTRWKRTGIFDEGLYMADAAGGDHGAGVDRRRRVRGNAGVVAGWAIHCLHIGCEGRNSPPATRPADRRKPCFDVWKFDQRGAGVVARWVEDRVCVDVA